MKKKVFNYVGLILLTLIVLYFALRNDFNKIINEIFNINPIFLLLSLFFIFCYWFFRAVVLKNFASKIKPNFSLFNAFKIHMSTIFFDNVTPFASGGQPYEIYKLSKEEKITFMTDEDNYVISSARERLIAWAAHEGKEITIDGDGVYSISQAKRSNPIFNGQLNVEDNTVTILLIVFTLGTSALSVFYLVKKKKENK